jgi:hypothetical protein
MPCILSAICFLPFSLTYFIVCAWKGLDGFNSTSIVNCIVSLLAALCLLQHVYYTSLLGACDFNSMRFDGTYKVGVKHYHSEKRDNEVMVFYPIDRAEYD